MSTVTTTGSTPAISATGLRKSFGDNVVLDGIDLEVPAGTVLADASDAVAMFLLSLPFLGSGFVPTDSLPTGVQWFAEYQPFTAFIETLRGLLLGTAIGHNAVLTIAWCVAIALGSYLWARASYDRRSVG